MFEGRYATDWPKVGTAAAVATGKLNGALPVFLLLLFLLFLILLFLRSAERQKRKDVFRPTGHGRV